MKTNKSENEFKYLVAEQLGVVTGGQHCYNAACLRRRNHAMTGAGDLLRGFVKGFTHQLFG